MKSDMVLTDPSKNVLDAVAREIRRLDDLRAAEHDFISEVATGLRREMKSEAERIDANRDYDRLEVRTSNDRHQTAVDTLAKGVETTRQTLAEQTEAKWKELDLRVRAVEGIQTAGTGKGAGLNAAWVYLGGLVALLVGLYALGSKFFGH